MSDQLHFIDHDNRIFEWWGLSVPGAPTVQPWSKSWVKGARFLDVFLVGAGAGGGGGTQKAVDGSASGPGGGASGGMVRARFILDTLPDTIYVFLPQGAAGGVSGGNGGNAEIASIILPHADLAALTAKDLLLASSATASTGGLNASTGGTGGTVTTGPTCLGSTLATALIGSPALAGVNGTTVASANVTTFLGVTGGAPGGGTVTVTTRGGGAINITSSTIPIVAGGQAVLPGVGLPGLWWRENPWQGWVSTGGSGGGSTNVAATVGGKGGDGAPGSGGGGGGVGTAAGGEGGRGGDSYLLLIAS